MSDLRKAAEMALETLRLFAVQEDEKGMAAIKTLIVIKEALQQEDWVGLTDAEVESWRGNYDFFDSALVREVEAKLKEKNA